MPNSSCVELRSGGQPGEYVLRFPGALTPGFVTLPPAQGTARFEVVPAPGAGTQIQRIQVRPASAGGDWVEPLAVFATAPEAQAALNELMNAWSAVQTIGPSRGRSRAAGATWLKAFALVGLVAIGLFGASYLSRVRDKGAAEETAVSPTSRSEPAKGDWDPPVAASASVPAPAAPPPSRPLPFRLPDPRPTAGSSPFAPPPPPPSLPASEPMAPVLRAETAAVVSAIAPEAATPDRQAAIRAITEKTGQFGGWDVPAQMPMPGRITATASNPGDVFIQTLSAPTLDYKQVAQMAPVPAKARENASASLGSAPAFSAAAPAAARPASPPAEPAPTSAAAPPASLSPGDAFLNTAQPVPPSGR